MGEGCKHLCVQGEVWWKSDTMRLHRTGFIQMSNVNKNITVEAKLISPPTYIGVHVTYSLFSSEFNRTRICRQTFEKYSNIKFHENPSSRSRVAPYGRTYVHTDRQDKPTHLKTAPTVYSQLWSAYLQPLPQCSGPTWFRHKTLLNYNKSTQHTTM